MKYSVPIKGKNERIEKTAYFYDMADRKTEEEFDTMLAKALVGQTDCGWK